MALTKVQVRRLLATDVGGERFVYGAALSTPTPSTTSFALAELVDAGSDKGARRDAWVWRPATGEERHTTEYDPSNGRVSVQRAFATAVTAAETMEIHRYPPSLLHQAINDALRRMKYADIVEITPVINQTQYSLAAYTYIQGKKDILGVYYKHTPLTGYVQPEEIRWFDVEKVAGVLYLYIDPPPVTSTNLLIWLKVKRPFPTLSATLESDTTDADELWLRAMSRVQLYKLLIQRTGPNKERARYEADLADALREARRYSKQQQPYEARKHVMTTPMWGPIWNRRRIGPL